VSAEAKEVRQASVQQPAHQFAHLYAGRPEVPNNDQEIDMSGVIQKETSVAAGAVNDNLLSGSAFEYLRAPAIISFAVVASATGAFITIQAGPSIILEESPPTVKTTMPTVPDDFLYTAAGAPGDRLVVRFRNPTGGALTARAVVQITDV
jgi:hypothetical protein